MAKRFLVDAATSTVWFKASSSVHPIHAEARGVEGELDAAWRRGALDVSGGVGGRLVVPVGGLASGNPIIDAEMRRRLGARRHPVITGTLKSLRPLGEGGYWAEAAVDFNDRTLAFEGTVTATTDDDGAGLVIEAEHAFDVRDLGIEPPRVLLLKVSPHVQVGMRLRLRLVPDPVR
jgi:hypothetical protein